MGTSAHDNHLYALGAAHKRIAELERDKANMHSLNDTLREANAELEAEMEWLKGRRCEGCLQRGKVGDRRYVCLLDDNCGSEFYCAFWAAREEGEGVSALEEYRKMRATKWLPETPERTAIADAAIAELEAENERLRVLFSHTCGTCRKWTTDECAVAWKDGDDSWVGSGDHDDYCPYWTEGGEMGEAIHNTHKFTFTSPVATEKVVVTGVDQHGAVQTEVVKVQPTASLITELEMELERVKWQLEWLLQDSCDMEESFFRGPMVTATKKDVEKKRAQLEHLWAEHLGEIK